MSEDRHVVLEELQRSIRNDWNETACDKAEQIFNSQEADINKLVESNKTMYGDYESLLQDYERLTDNPTVDFNGQSFNTEAIGILFEQQAAAGRTIEAACKEIEDKDDMIDAMIEGFNLRNRIHHDTYDVGDYDWQLILNRIKLSEPNEWLERIRQMAEELTQLKNEILDGR